MIELPTFHTADGRTFYINSLTLSETNCEDIEILLPAGVVPNHVKKITLSEVKNGK